MTEWPVARQHRRFSIDIETTVTAGERQLSSRARDVSRSGICIISPEPVAGGTAISVDLVLALAENTFSEPLKLDGRVVWCTPIAGSYQVGAMFVGLDRDKVRFLEMFLRFLDGSLTPDGAGPQDEGDEAPRGKPKVDNDDPFRP